MLSQPAATTLPTLSFLEQPKPQLAPNIEVAEALDEMIGIIEQEQIQEKQRQQRQELQNQIEHQELLLVMNELLTEVATADAAEEEAKPPSAPTRPATPTFGLSNNFYKGESEAARIARAALADSSPKQVQLAVPCAVGTSEVFSA